MFYTASAKSIEKLFVFLAEKIGLVFLPSVPRAEIKMLFSMPNVPVVEEIDPVMAQSVAGAKL